MSPLPRRQVKAGKRKRREALVNAVPGENGSLIHILDDSGRKWLVDGGALVSIIPPNAAQRVNGPASTSLTAANGSSIKTFGSVNLNVVLGKRLFSYSFIIADVQQPILGADFLATFSLAPNHRDGTVLCLDTLEVVARSVTLPVPPPNTSSINEVHASLDPRFETILDG